MSILVLEDYTQKAHALMPYTKFIGLDVVANAQGQILFRLPFKEENIGNTRLPALHGGLIGGFLESASVLFLYAAAELEALPKMVDFSLDYLRSGKPETLYARCAITRQGSRIAHVAIEAWQSAPDKPVATARAHFLLPPRG